MRIAALASGAGTNLQALLDAQSRGELSPGEIQLVIANRPRSMALQRGSKAGVATVCIDHKAFSSKEAFEEAMLAELDAHQIEAVVLAGFMRILSPIFVQRFPERILNTHPALCPAFPGIRAPQQAIDAGVKVTGCTVHFVDEGVDTGPIVFQTPVSIAADDTAESLHQRIQKHEHELLPQAAQLMAAGQLVCVGRHVHVRQP